MLEMKQSMLEIKQSMFDRLFDIKHGSLDFKHGLLYFNHIDMDSLTLSENLTLTMGLTANSFFDN